MGAHEYQGPGISGFLGWLEEHHLSTDGSEDRGDPDGDGVTTDVEYLADTDPTDAASRLMIQAVQPWGRILRLHWQGGVVATQYVDFAEELLPVGTVWRTCFTNVPPTAVLTNLLISPGFTGRKFFRIRAARGN